MGGDRQSTWEHMAPNKQQAMCSTHRDIWWPAWAHQQDRDITPPFKERIPDAPHTLNRKMSRREVGQARGVEEGLEQWAHRGARVGLALERALWVPRPERGPGTEWTAWAPRPERALERSLCAP